MPQPESNLNQEELNKLIDERFKKIFSFTNRKLSDTPTDDLMLVPRKYVNAHGTVANRPNASVVGVSYFATDTKIKMTSDGTSWYNGVASIVA